MKVYQFYNKNQFRVEDESARYFQSYQSMIAKWDFTTHKLTLGRDWDYSNTTRKHLYLFINEYTSITLDKKPYNKTIDKLIENGVILYDEEL